VCLECALIEVECHFDGEIPGCVNDLIEILQRLRKQGPKDIDYDTLCTSGVSYFCCSLR
jgi:hypothetical protein